MIKLKRIFLNVADVELEICMDDQNRYFVRHHLYWYIAHNKKNPDPKYDCIIDNLNVMVNNRVKTVKWSGYNFKFHHIFFEEDNMEVDAVLIPLKMFEEFIGFHANNYKGIPPENECTKLAKWLENHSLIELLK